MTTCRGCPSFVPSAQSGAVFGRATQMDMCQRYGHVLSRPGNPDSADEKLCETFASTCPSLGHAAPDNVVLLAQVALPDPALIMRATGRGPVAATDKPNACTTCEFFVHPKIVRDELGWTQPMCALKGRLLVGTNLVAEASACDQGYTGTPRTTTDGMTLMSQYDTTGAFAGATSATPVAMSKRITNHRVDPREYETDRPVSEDDANYNCIRAWRRIDSTEPGKEPIYLPIFDGERLCGFDPRKTYGSHRPDLYIDHQGLLYDLAVEMYQLNETPVLIGPAGVGKTEIGCWMAYMMDLPFYRLSVKKGTEAWHFIGEAKLETKEVEVEVLDPVTGEKKIVHDVRQVTEFHRGRFAEHYDKACVIMVDEPNLEQTIFELLRPVFDSAKQLTIDEDQGFTIAQHPFCFPMCSQNPADDPIYVGAEPMSAADLDRITPIQVGLPPEAIERQIIVERCADDDYQIPVETLDKIMQIAGDLRRMIGEEGSLPISWGIRAQIKVARKTQYYGLPKAYRRALVDGLDRDVVDTVMSVVHTVAS